MQEVRKERRLMAFGVIIYEEEQDSFLEMSDEKAGIIVKNMIRAFKGIELEPVEGELKFYAKSLCQRVEADKNRAVESSINGKKGGAPKGNQNAKKNNLKQPTLVLDSTLGCFENKPNNNSNNNRNSNNNKKNTFANNCIRSDIDIVELEKKVIKNQ